MRGGHSPYELEVWTTREIEDTRFCHFQQEMEHEGRQKKLQVSKNNDYPRENIEDIKSELVQRYLIERQDVKINHGTGNKRPPLSCPKKKQCHPGVGQ